MNVAPGGEACTMQSLCLYGDLVDVFRPMTCGAPRTSTSPAPPRSLSNTICWRSWKPSRNEIISWIRFSALTIFIQKLVFIAKNPRLHDKKGAVLALKYQLIQDEFNRTEKSISRIRFPFDPGQLSSGRAATQVRCKTVSLALNDYHLIHLWICADLVLAFP